MTGLTPSCTPSAPLQNHISSYETHNLITHPEQIAVVSSLLNHHRGRIEPDQPNEKIDIFKVLPDCIPDDNHPAIEVDDSADASVVFFLLPTCFTLGVHRSVSNLIGNFSAIF